MKTNELKDNYDNLTPKQKKLFIKELCDGLLEYQKLIDKHRNYLESLPTKEQRIKESQRIRKEYYGR